MPRESIEDLKDRIDELEAENETLEEENDSLRDRLDSINEISSEEQEEGEALRQPAAKAGVRKPIKSQIEGSGNGRMNAGHPGIIAFGVEPLKS